MCRQTWVKPRNKFYWKIRSAVFEFLRAGVRKDMENLVGALLLILKEPAPKRRSSFGRFSASAVTCPPKLIIFSGLLRLSLCAPPAVSPGGQNSCERGKKKIELYLQWPICLTRNGPTCAVWPASVSLTVSRNPTSIALRRVSTLR
jgi:hypothetical protein